MSLDEQARELLKAAYADLQATGATSRIEDASRLLEADLDPGLKASLANLLGHHFFHVGRYDDALRYCMRWLEHDPDDAAAIRAVLSSLVRLRRWEDVINKARQHLAKRYDDYDLHSTLCNALGHMGRLEEARGHGTLALALKDAGATAKARDLSAIPVPSFNEGNPKKNVIAFSLFGTQKRYSQGALKNARAAQFIYPCWTCRFYVDVSVNDSMLQSLAAEGAEVRLVNGLPREKFGRFWRFLIADDPSVDRFLVRDCDSVLSVRERVAVDEWISSGKHFHVMRDFYTHSELVLAGLWGGVRSALPPIGPAMRAYVDGTIYHRTLDQEFLRETLWPTMRQSLLTHDTQFAFGERRDFPAGGTYGSGHVGYAQF